MAEDRCVIHIVPHEDGWQVTEAGRVVGSYRTKDAAQQAGRELAQAESPSQLITHTADGRIEDEATYEGDPSPPRG